VYRASPQEAAREAPNKPAQHEKVRGRLADLLRAPCFHLRHVPRLRQRPRSSNLIECSLEGRRPGMIGGIADAIQRGITEPLRPVPELACAALVTADDADDLWLVADVDPVAAAHAPPLRQRPPPRPRQSAAETGRWWAKVPTGSDLRGRKVK